MFGLREEKKKNPAACLSASLETAEEAERLGAARSVQPEVTWLHSNSGQADLWGRRGGASDRPAHHHFNYSDT